MEQCVAFLMEKYDQAESTFTLASPFGQLLAVIANISELIFTYIAHTAEELNIQTARNHETIFGLSRLTGHDPYRGSSAYGQIWISLNSNVVAGNDNLMHGDNLTIRNFTKLEIKESGETYFLNLPSDYIKLTINTTTETISNEYKNGIAVDIFQGEIESQTFTSNGTALQTFNPIVKNMTDHYNVSVTVNGKPWTRVESLYDMPSDDEYGSGECFMVKSSINVGLTIIFGNGYFGSIPPAGAEIVVTYIKTAGALGNVYTEDMTITFVDYGVDDIGNEIPLDDVLTCSTIFPPSLGCNYESPEFTKLIAPRTSKSFVLANPDNYETFLSRYNQFSSIHAYYFKTNVDEIRDYYLNLGEDYYDNEIEIDRNIICIKALPNIKKKLNKNQDYFDLKDTDFIISDMERWFINDALEKSGRQVVGVEPKILDKNDITIQKFVINVIIRRFKNFDESVIRNEVRSILSKYFLNINRNDIIPCSDIIALVETISGVDTCDVFFITEKNENAKINGGYFVKENAVNNLQSTYINRYKTVIPGEDPMVGMDEFGNIIIDDNEIYIPYGGWSDANGNYYNERVEVGKLCALNIFFPDKEGVDDSVYNQTLQKNLTNLLKNNY